jgi:hypothetical protein
LRPLYIVSHIPKTAGSTLRCNFELNFSGAAWLPADVPGTLEWDEVTGNKSPSELKAYIDGRVREEFDEHSACIFGHWAYYGIHEAIPVPWRDEVTPRYLTFLREPVARVVSMYRYNARTGRSSSHQEIKENDWSLEEWFERSGNPRRRNGQVRHLLLGSHPDIMTRAELNRRHLDEAKARLREFWFVGLTETFTEDSAYLYGRLNFRKFMPAASVNVSEGKFEAEPRAQEAITRGNELDHELYVYARELREKGVLHAPDFGLATSRYKRARGMSDLRSRVAGTLRGLLPGGAKAMETSPSSS